jgi:hypothetical protein
LLVAATLAFGLLAGPATARKKKGPKGTKQEYVGAITLPAPYPADTTCFTGLERRLAQTGAPANGIVGDHFTVDPKTAGQKFQLHMIGGSDDVDLDIVFYANYGDPADPNTTPAYVGFETREPGGESGTVPPGMNEAIVCLYSGQEAEFHYITK